MITQTTDLFLNTLLPQPLLIVLLQLLVDLGSLRGFMAVQRRLHSSASRHYRRQLRRKHTGAVGSFLNNSASFSYGIFALLRSGCCSAEASLLAIVRLSSTPISYVDTGPNRLSDGGWERDILESKSLWLFLGPSWYRSRSLRTDWGSLRWSPAS
jgi:hypothetical protein